MPRRLVQTKYFSFTQKMREHLRHVPPGEPIPTIDELRELLRTSRGTVDRVLENLRKDGLIYRPSGKQRYVVATYADHAARRIALIRPDYPSPSFEALARWIVEAGRQHDWVFDLQYYRTMGALDLRRSIGDNEAAVLIPTSEDIPEHILQVLRRPHHPIVIVQENLDDPDISTVCLDDYQIGYVATKHLLSLGHRRILALLDQPHVPITCKRQQGWREAMEEAGIDNIDELVADCNVQPGDDAREMAYQHMRELLREDPRSFTAIFCTSDVGAMATIRALSEAGLTVPDDMSVAAHGGESNLGPFLLPPLTAAETDMRSYGNAVIEMLTEHLKDSESKSKSVMIAPELVVRSTTKSMQLAEIGS